MSDKDIKTLEPLAKTADAGGKKTDEAKQGGGGEGEPPLPHLLEATVEVVGMGEVGEGRTPLLVGLMTEKQPGETGAEEEGEETRLEPRPGRGRRRLVDLSLWRTRVSAVAASRVGSATSSRTDTRHSFTVPWQWQSLRKDCFDSPSLFVNCKVIIVYLSLFQ